MESNEEKLEQNILEVVTKWQAVESPIAPLSQKQRDVVYKTATVCIKDKKGQQAQKDQSAICTSNDSYTNFWIKIEKCKSLATPQDIYIDEEKCKSKGPNFLSKDVENVIKGVWDLQKMYRAVTTKTDSLHNLSEQLMKHQMTLKDKKVEIEEVLKHFRVFKQVHDNLALISSNVNGSEFSEMLDSLDRAYFYCCDHPFYKDASSYSAKFENLLYQSLSTVKKYFGHVINETTAQVKYLDNKASLAEANSKENLNSAFSFYYGQFHNAALKVNNILGHIEKKAATNTATSTDTLEIYQSVIYECQVAYFHERTPMISAAVIKALNDLKENNKNDHSVLFRSSCLFLIKLCQDETNCYHLFFDKPSHQLHDYLKTLCVYLYDMLRPCSISINHLEVLSELCSLIKNMLNDQNSNDPALEQFVYIINQLLHDLEERLVFRTNVYFERELLGYIPSPGDLAYPEKLEQMENIAEELVERRSNSSASVESQEVSQITSTFSGQFRSYTGNSPADLHGMWYPTVKRSLVCLSRLYFCLNREIFQGLAQEALLICVKTIDNASQKISASKGSLHGKLFQIKHLLIIREQIAPFHVDFTAKEFTLDFSNCKAAAAHLVQNKDKLFSLSSNNALIEFLLEGTPKVREYLVDSRKEMDKELKATCEAFILSATNLLVGNLTEWLQKAEHVLKIYDSLKSNAIPLRDQDHYRPLDIAEIVNIAQKNIKTKVPEIQRYMKLYLANRETEFILFRPIKNNLITSFMQLEQLLLAAKYTEDDILMISCPTPDQLNMLISSVSLTADQFQARSRSRHSSVHSSS